MITRNHPRFNQYKRILDKNANTKQSHFKGIHQHLTGITTKAMPTVKKMRHYWNKLSPDQKKTILHLAAMAII
jgi:hypothetical protein